MTPPSPAALDVSVVLPVHNERDNLAPLLDEVQAALVRAGRSFEVVAVDDGSTDGSVGVLRDLAATRRWLRVVVFRRNSGQSAALDAGFRMAAGRLIITMDADRQNDPADIPRMLEVLEREDCDLVAGRRANRQDGFVLRKLPSRVANFIIRKVTGTKLRDLGCSLKVFRRECVEDLSLYGEMHRFIGVLVEGTGARTVEVDVNHRARTAGKSKYGLDRTVKVLLDLCTVKFMRSYQTKPIYIFGSVGVGLGLLSVVLAAWVLYERIANDIFVHKQPLFILAVILAVIGFQFLVLGLLAELQIRTYFESSRRPPYYIRERINFEGETPAAGAPIIEAKVTSTRTPSERARVHQ